MQFSDVIDFAEFCHNCSLSFAVPSVVGNVYWSSLSKDILLISSNIALKLVNYFVSGNYQIQARSKLITNGKVDKFVTLV